MRCCRRRLFLNSLQADPGLSSIPDLPSTSLKTRKHADNASMGNLLKLMCVDSYYHEAGKGEAFFQLCFHMHALFYTLPLFSCSIMSPLFLHVPLVPACELLFLSCCRLCLSSCLLCFSLPRIMPLVCSSCLLSFHHASCVLHVAPPAAVGDMCQILNPF